MGKTVIQVENLSKAYQIGQFGTGTISKDVERFWQTKIRGKEDPFLKIGETNYRNKKGESDIVWSLRDIDFEIQAGDSVGIIGKNGAGKSTLLKLLSRVTSPTTGAIKIKGRIASLLEVGTGFHPELSGRENVYLNGAILGMRKKEITRKLDEIIDFSGVERYVDTPVKRFSSGMYVRLAFAVAAHLESEILIVDEVLAVGDAEFQKKCLGKMGDISKGEGRTVLFVSHNMSAVQNLCDKSILLENGLLKKYDSSKKIVSLYNNIIKENKLYTREKPGLFQNIVFNKIIVINNQSEITNNFNYDEDIYIAFELLSEKRIEDNNLYSLFCIILNENGIRVCSFESQIIKTNKLKLKINKKFLVRGSYYINAIINVPNYGRSDEVTEVCNFEIVDNESTLSIHGDYDYGLVFPNGEWVE